MCVHMQHVCILDSESLRTMVGRPTGVRKKGFVEWCADGNFLNIQPNSWKSRNPKVSIPSIFILRREKN